MLRGRILTPHVAAYAHTGTAVNQAFANLLATRGDVDIALGTLLMADTAESNFLLAIVYCLGLGNVMADSKSSDRHLHKAMRMHCAAAYGWCGYRVLTHTRETKHLVQGVKLLNMAATQRDPDGLVNLALLLHPTVVDCITAEDRGNWLPEPNEAKSKALFRLAIQMASPLAYMVVATTHLHGSQMKMMSLDEYAAHALPKQDDDVACRERALDHACRMGLPIALFTRQLLRECKDGWQGTRNQAVEAYTLAACMGSPAALNAWAVHVLVTTRTTMTTKEGGDVSLALAHLQRAAAAGLAVAQHNLAECALAHVWSIPENKNHLAVATNLLLQSAKQGLAASAWRLALLALSSHHHSHGDQPSEEADKWIERAEELMQCSREQSESAGCRLGVAPLFARPVQYAMDDEEHLPMPTAEYPTRQPAFASPPAFWIVGIQQPVFPRALSGSRVSECVRE